MPTVRRVSLMPVADDKDRCARCGKVIRQDSGHGFVDIKYARRMRVDAKCAIVLRAMSGYKELK